MRAATTYACATRRLARLLLLLCALLGGDISVALASGTPAGTAISNQATVVYTAADGEETVIYANTLSFLVSQIAVVNITPAAGTKTAPLNRSVDYPITITNSGNGSDYLLLSAASSLDLPVTIYYDADGDGSLSESERSAGPIVKSKRLEADMQLGIIARLQIPDSSSLNGKQDTVTVTATSAHDTTRSASGSYLTSIASPLLVVTTSVSNPLPTASSRVTCTIAYSNRGHAAATGVQVSDVLNGNLRHVYGSGSPPPSSASGQTLAWNIGTVEEGASGAITFVTDVVNGLKVGSEIHNIADVAYRDGSGDHTLSSREINFITISPGGAQTVALGPGGNSQGEPGDTVERALTLNNNGVAEEAFDLDFSSSSGLEWIFYRDLDSNGSIDTGEPAVISTGVVAGGEGAHLVARSVLPMVNIDRTIDSTLFRAVSIMNGSNAAQCTGYTTVNIPVMKLEKSVDFSAQRAGGEITYTINYSNAGSGRALEFQIADPIPANTVFVPGSITVDSVGKTDSADGDEAQYSNGILTVNVGTVVPASSGTIEFRVRIN
jgi:uncharacterized repeat protein (TIGR01451 family)